MLPYSRQTIEDDDVQAVAEALRGQYLTTGPLVGRFEAAVAQRVGARHAVACANGTAALHLAMLALGVQPGEAVVVPTTTFLATANCARYVGAEVTFADVDPESGLMTPETLAEALGRVGDRPLRAVLPVHLRGDVAELPALARLAAQAGAVLVEDAAHALGSAMAFDDVAERVGDNRHSAMTAFSFHAVKTITTAEGGMVTTNDDSLAERLRLACSHGMVRPQAGPAWWYEMPEIGFNYRLPDVLCALGLSQLAKLERFAARRQALAARYQAELAELSPLVRIAASPAWSRPVLHLMTVLIDFETAGRDRSEVMAALRSEGIGTQVHYIPVHRQPYYEQRYGPLVLPGAERWYARALSLPLHPMMEEAEVGRIAGALRKALRA